MSDRLRPLILDDFQGGINLRANQFHLGETESPYMLNVEIDPRGGIFTRKGWSRWFDGPNIDTDSPATVWEPRNAFGHVYSNRAVSTFVTNEGKLWHSPDSGTFADTTLVCNALPHLCDFASWGDKVYLAPGKAAPTAAYWNGTALVNLSQPGGSDPGEGQAGPSWNNDYTLPKGDHMPIADYVEPHAGYIFVASINEDTGSGFQDHPTRIRWSHPGGNQEDWAYNDYIDIDVGGGYITALMSFQDHLLIFKDDSLWGLYGYDNNSWQLIQIARAVGAPSPGAITRSEGAAYFYSNSGRNAIYGYSGQGAPVEISNQIRIALEEILHPNNVWLAWTQNRLWCSIPWLLSETGGISPLPNPGGGGAGIQGVPTDTATSTFVFDLTIGEGVWTLFRPDIGSLGPIVEGADVFADLPLAVYWGDGGVGGSEERCMLSLGALSQAYDEIKEGGSMNATPWNAVYTTGWKHMGLPETLKSWRRPTFVMRTVIEDYAMRVESFRDYDETAAKRVHSLFVTTEGTPYWRAGGFDDAAGDGFDWADPTGETTPAGRGASWAGASAGSDIIRTVDSNPQGGGFGKAKAMQFRFSTENAYLGRAWGLDAMINKVISREFTT